MGRKNGFEDAYRDIHGGEPEVILAEQVRTIYVAAPEPKDPFAGWSPLARLAFAIPLLLVSTLVGLIGLGALVLSIVVIIAILKGG